MNLKDSLVRGASATMLVQMAGMGLSWASAVVLARLLGVEGYGAYALLISVVTILRLPASFGAAALLLREVSASRANENWGRMRGVSRWTLRFCLITSIPVTISIFIGAYLFGDQIPDTLQPSLPWVAALVIVLPLAALRGGVLRGLGKVVWSYFPEQIIRPLLLLTLALAPFLWGGIINRPEEAMAINVMATVAAWLVGTIMLMTIWPKQVREATPEQDGPGWRKSLLSLGLGNAMYMLDGEVAVLALGLVASKADVGVFKAASQFAILAGLGYAVITANVSPRIAAAWSKNNLAAVQKTVTDGSRLSMLYCVPVSLGLAALGGWGVPFVMGPGFEGAWAPLAILALGHLINAAFGSSTAVLTMTHHERGNAVAFAIGLVVNVGLTLILTPMFGAIGAATAVTASIILRNLILWIYVRRQLGIETGFWGRSARPASAQD